MQRKALEGRPVQGIGGQVGSIPISPTIQSSRTAETVVDRKEAVSAGILDLQMAHGAQISDSRLGDAAGIGFRDNMINVPRSDIAVPLEVRREQLTQRFLGGLRELSSREVVVLFFDAVEKMSDITSQWLWEQLLPPVRDGALSNVRAVLCGQRRPPQV